MTRSKDMSNRIRKVYQEINRRYNPQDYKELLMQADVPENLSDVLSGKLEKVVGESNHIIKIPSYKT